MRTQHNKSILHKGALITALLLAFSFNSFALAGDWSLKDTNGVRYKLSDQKGKWVLVNFWAPWCPPCIAELPDLNALQLQHKDVLIIGVAVQFNSKKEVLGMVKSKSLSYPIVFGNEDTAADFGGLEGLPTSFLYSPAGKLVGHHEGGLTQDEVEQFIAQKPEAAGLFTN